MGLLVRPAGQTSWADQLDRPAGRTSWTDQFFLVEALAIRIGIFEDFPFSLYIVAASESDEGLVSIWSLMNLFNNKMVNDGSTSPKLGPN